MTKNMKAGWQYRRS